MNINTLTQSRDSAPNAPLVSVYIKHTCSPHQVDEGEELPAASVGLVRRHVQRLVVAEDGEVGEEDGDPEHLRGDQRHDGGVCGGV